MLIFAHLVKEMYQASHTDQLAEPQSPWWRPALIHIRDLSGDQLTPSQMPYALHNAQVAKRLWDLYGERNLTIAGLFHDCLERHLDITSQELQYRYGDMVFLLIESVTRYTRAIDTIQKILAVCQSDIRPLLIKLADIEQMLSWIAELPPKQTMDVYLSSIAVYHSLYGLIRFGEETDIELQQRKLQEVISERGTMMEYILEFVEYYLRNPEQILEEFSPTERSRVRIVVDDRRILQRFLKSQECMEIFECHSLQFSEDGVRATFGWREVG